MNRNVIETVMGAVVLAVAGLFLAFAYSTADLQQVEGYEVWAQFDHIEGLGPGSDVRIGGVKVGSIVRLELNREYWVADVHMSIDPSIRLPSDTFAVIRSESLLGGKFMALEPGIEEDTIPDGGKITFTQSVPGLEQLLGEVIYQLQQTGSSDDG